MKEPGPEHRAYTRTAIVTRLRDADNFSYFDACRGADAIEELEAENDALRSRAEAAEKDAARYRWIRQSTADIEGPAAYAPWCGPPLFDAALDAAIDAAIDAARKEGK